MAKWLTKTVEFSNAPDYGWSLELTEEDCIAVRYRQVDSETKEWKTHSGVGAVDIPKELIPEIRKALDWLEQQ